MALPSPPVLALLFLALGCAVVDARSYRIPDVLTAPLLCGVFLVLSFSPGGGAAPSLADGLAAFLFLYPVLLFLWYGAPLPPPEEATPGEDDAESRPFEWAAFADEAWRLLFAASPFSWAAAYVAGVFLVSPLLAWSAIPMALCALALAAWRGKRSWMGGGDKKMLAAGFALAGMSGAAAFSLWLSLCTLLLVGFLWMRRRGGAGGWAARRVPAGVAIAAAMAGLALERAWVQAWVS